MKLAEHASIAQSFYMVIFERQTSASIVMKFEFMIDCQVNWYWPLDRTYNIKYEDSGFSLKLFIPYVDS